MYGLIVRPFPERKILFMSYWPSITDAVVLLDCLSYSYYYFLMLLSFQWKVKSDVKVNVETFHLFFVSLLDENTAAIDCLSLASSSRSIAAGCFLLVFLSLIQWFGFVVCVTSF